jgi:DNA polymerase
MNGDFYSELTEVLRREAAHRPGMTVSPETMRALAAAANTPREAEQNTPAQRSSFKSSALQSAPAAATAAGALSTANTSLDEMQKIVSACRQCRLAETRKNVVFGEGNPQAELMFIGEGPGEDEDLQGRPFVGKAGQLLDKMIAAMQFKREDVYIANIVKCRPPANRVPMPDEVSCCIDYLKRQVELINPKAIVLLGATAVRFMLNTDQGIMRMRGKWTKFGNIPVMPTFHPAFLLRQESAKREAWSDLQQVMALFGKKYQGKKQ